jgi:uncharacterized protein YbjT (DUF2867 family)
MNDAAESKTVFLTGATGYIGGRLVLRLLERGYRVRCLVRDARKLAARPWVDAPGAEIVEGEIDEPGLLAERMRGCTHAFYLVHSMVAAGSDYARTDRRLARIFAAAATEAGLQRIVYLGGLGETGANLSEHLASRREVESALGSGPVPVTVFRAAMIIGAGSASFEILRYLVERLPVMVTPRWVSTECQPIAVENVLGYLVACLDNTETTGRTLDIGGPDVVTYRTLMEELAEARGLARRLVIPVGVLTPRLSSLWIHLITPLDHRIARPLAEGLRHRVVCRNDEAQRLIPQDLLTVREAIDHALAATGRGDMESAWTDAGVMPGDPGWAGGTVFEDRREVIIDASPANVFCAICRVGGGHGYYAADWLWKLRGFLDRLVGGPGLRRGRRRPETAVYGDALDFWRVTDVEPERRLELRAEMKLPGEAMLSFALEPLAAGRTRLVQTARFKPRGLLGLTYWYAVVPLHGVVFRGMLRGIERAARGLQLKPRPPRIAGASRRSQRLCA